MKITCLRFRRALSEYAATDREIPPESSLSEHLAGCEECSRELDWFRAAHHGLEASLMAEQISAGFTDAAWARFTTAARPGRSFAAVFALSSAACVTSIATLFFFWTSRSPMQLNNTARTAPALAKVANNDTGQPGAKSNQEKPTSRNGSPAINPEKKGSHKVAIFRHQRIRFLHGKQRIAHRTSHKNSAPAQLASAPRTHPARTQTVSWVQIASRYEYLGDYRSAAAAYARAAHERPADSLVFNAGRTSECAGNVAQAVEYYTRILKREREQEPQPKQDSQPKKGTWQWNENWGSA